jgi:hypothetical protein
VALVMEGYDTGLVSNLPTPRYLADSLADQ